MGLLHDLTRDGVTAKEIEDAIAAADDDLMGPGVSKLGHKRTINHHPHKPLGARPVVVQILGNAAGGGKYNANAYFGEATFGPTGTLTLAEGMQNNGLPTGTAAPGDCLVANSEENAKPTHWLATGSYAIGEIVGETTETNPRLQVVIPMGVGRTVSPNTIGGSSEGSESASTDSWSRGVVTSGNTYGDGPVDVYMISRVVYNPSGDKKLYGFYRTFSFDSRGMLVTIGAEARYEIDAPVTCS